MSFPRNLMTLADLTPSQINQVVGLARRLKRVSKKVLPPVGATLREAAWKEAALDHTKLAAPPQSLRNLSVALLFSKRSTRTRLAAETAAKLLGGQAIFLGKDDIQLGINESARDTAIVFSRMVQGIFARVGDHAEIEELTKHATVPVINALSSLWHPTQVLADLQTLYEETSLQQDSTPSPPPYSIPYSDSSSSEQVKNSNAAQYRSTQAKRRIRPLTIAYVGDSANVLHDMLVTYPRLGHKLQVATPLDPKYRAPTPVWDKVVELGCDKSIQWVSDPRDAVKDADVIATDTWISMGQEAEYEQRVRDFQGYQVTEELCQNAKQDWKFLHCLPRKSHEVNDEVFYGPRSLAFRVVENRKWTTMALFHIMFGGGSYNALPHGRPAPLYQPGQHQAQQKQATLTEEQLTYLNTKINTVLQAAKKIENRRKTVRPTRPADQQTGQGSAPGEQTAQANGTKESPSAESSATTEEKKSV